eukprot:1151281-Pelagomonas_calceolata.AAC.3
MKGWKQGQGGTWPPARNAGKHAQRDEAGRPAANLAMGFAAPAAAAAPAVAAAVAAGGGVEWQVAACAHVPLPLPF